jgi:hypothetical protein
MAWWFGSREKRMRKGIIGFIAAGVVLLAGGGIAVTQLRYPGARRETTYKAT